MCVRLLAEADAPPARPWRNARAGRDPVSRRVRTAACPRAAGASYGVTLTTFLDQTPLPQPQTDLEPEATPADLASLEAETAEDLRLDPRTVLDLTPAVRPAAARPTPTPKADADDGDEPVEHEDVLDIEDSTRLYLREIARVPILTAEEEVMLAKTMELGKRIESDPASAVLDLHVWGVNDSEPKARTKHQKYPHVFLAESARIVEAALSADDALDLLVTAPKVGLTDEIAAAGGEASELLERARNLRAVYNERLDVESFIAILDFVHGALLRPVVRDSAALIALRAWSRS